MGKLENKAAIVTGGGRGIGRSIALSLAAERCNVAVVSRTKNEIESVANEIKEAGASGLAIPADISQIDDVSKMVDLAIEAFGQIDILVNNAGIAIFKPFTELTVEDWDKTMAVNMRGAFLCSQKVAQTMIENGSGTIITICSSASRKPYPNQMAYVTSKHGLLGLTKGLGLELRPYGIKVHAICPGGVDTKLTADARPGTDRSEWMQPEDIAHVALMLLTQNDRTTIDEVYIRRYDAAPIY